jgi:hypothetical protein
MLHPRLSRQQSKHQSANWQPTWWLASSSGQSASRDSGPFRQRKNSGTVDIPLFSSYKFNGTDWNRVVHAKGAGAFGEFEVTKDISDLTSAHFLREVGVKTKVFTRFSTVGPERGSADSIRDVRGWAFKFITEEGNLDWVFNSTVSLDSEILEVATNYLACLLH